MNGKASNQAFSLNQKIYYVWRSVNLKRVNSTLKKFLASCWTYQNKIFVRVKYQLVYSFLVFSVNWQKSSWNNNVSFRQNFNCMLRYFLWYFINYFGVFVICEIIFCRLCSIDFGSSGKDAFTGLQREDHHIHPVVEATFEYHVTTLVLGKSTMCVFTPLGLQYDKLE